MKTYEFTIELHDVREPFDVVEDAIFVSQAADGTLSQSGDIIKIHFTRMGRSIQDVIDKAVLHVRRAIPDANVITASFEKGDDR